MELRPYQTKVINDIHNAWNEGARNVCVQLATGAGKTVIFSHIMAAFGAPCIAIAHRMELVSQISLTLARYGIYHTLIAQKAAIREIVAIHMQELGRSYFDVHARCYVAGVDTLVKLPVDTPWFHAIKLVVQDEGHHPLRENKWGRAATLFPNAVGLYPTATPVRADGKGLGRSSDGIFDRLIIGMGMRDLIKAGYLTDYRIFAPPSALDLSNVPVTATGDYSPPKLRQAVHKSQITGDIVSHYLRIAPGKLGVTFAVDLEAAGEIAEAFRAAGVSAEVISGKTPDLLRASLMRRFRNREILQLVNVDLLGEGVDVPAIEVVSFARPTQSFAVYSQQFGRALRPMEGKTHAYIIDHVNNVIRHGLPDSARLWSLDRRDRRARRANDDGIPLRTCTNFLCLLVYPRTLSTCPHCGTKPIVSSRGSPEQVDGDLFELDADALAHMRGERDRIDGAPRIPKHLDPIAQKAVANRHKERQLAQRELRGAIAQWAGYRKAEGLTDSEIYRLFYFTYGTDVMTAQTLNTNDAEKLIDEISSKL